MNESLIERARAGDKAAENDIFKTLRDSFLLIAKHRLRDLPHKTHEDIVQEACTTVLEKYRTERFDRGFMQWAYGVLRNKIGNAYQESARRRSVDSDSVASREIIGPLEGQSLRMAIIRCFEKLVNSNLRYARLVNLAHQGYSTDEICKRLDLTKQNCHTLLSRGRARIRECLEDSDASR